MNDFPLGLTPGEFQTQIGDASIEKKKGFFQEPKLKIETKEYTAAQIYANISKQGGTAQDRQQALNAVNDKFKEASLGLRGRIAKNRATSFVQSALAKATTGGGFSQGYNRENFIKSQ